MNYISGIVDYVNLKDFDIMDIKKLYMVEEFVKMGILFFLDFVLGKGWFYLNIGYVLLGIFIEKVIGNSYVEEVENWIIELFDLLNIFLFGNLSVILGIKYVCGYL